MVRAEEKLLCAEKSQIDASAPATHNLLIDAQALIEEMRVVFTSSNINQLQAEKKSAERNWKGVRI